MEFLKHTTPNGLTIIGERNPQAKSVALGYFVRTGSRDETPEVSGVSHFLEHMMFKGNENLSPQDINREFDRIGAKYNAFTSEEVTAYHGAVLPERQTELLELLTSMMRPSLRQDDFDTEKHVILEEIEMYKDRPTFVAFDAIRPLYFDHHPLGQSILGSSESITALTRNAMLEYFTRRYAPNNLLLAAAGNMDWDALLDQAGQLTSGWTRAQTGREYPAFAAQPRVQVIETTKFNRAHIALMAPGYGSNDPRRYAAGVLAQAIGDTEGSRLYWALVDNGLADNASLDHNAEDGLGSYAAYTSTDPERAQTVLDTLCNVLLEVQEHGITQHELERAKRKLAVGLTLRAETPYGQLFPLGLEYLDTSTYLSLQDTVQHITQVTLEEVRSVLNDRPFDRLTIVGLGPISSLN